MGDNIALEDPGGLHAFAKALRDIADYLDNHQQSSESLVAVPPFGQTATTYTQVPQKLGESFAKSMAEIGGNLQTMIDKLRWAADKADMIANKYVTTHDLDKLSVADIQADLGITPGG